MYTNPNPEWYPLDAGQWVYDRRDTDGVHRDTQDIGRSIVLERVDEDVHELEFDGEPLSAYPANVEYADYDVSTRVVRVIWESDLDRYVPGWRNHVADIGSLRDHIDVLINSYSVPVFEYTYDYPESRLIPVEQYP